MKLKVNKINLLRGQDEQFLLFLLTPDMDFFQIHGATILTMSIVKTDKTILEKAPVTGISNGYGDTMWLYQFVLTAAEIDSLPLQSDQDVSIKAGFGSYNKYLTIPKCISVSKRGF